MNISNMPLNQNKIIPVLKTGLLYKRSFTLHRYTYWHIMHDLNLNYQYSNQIISPAMEEYLNYISCISFPGNYNVEIKKVLKWVVLLSPSGVN